MMILYMLNVIGRIAVIKEYRGKKVGQYIVQSACSLIQGNVCLHAQLQAKPFYEKIRVLLLMVK